MNRKLIKTAVLILIVALTVSHQAGAVAALYTNVYYALQSYHERYYTEYSDQIALGWAEIRSTDGDLYFTQQKKDFATKRLLPYGVPEGDISALVREMKSNGNKLMLSVFLDNSTIFRSMLDSDTIQQQIIKDMVEAVSAIRSFDYNAAADAKGVYPSQGVTDAQGKIISYDGIIIDFEGLFDRYIDKPGVSYRQKFTTFLQNLRDSLPQDKLLSVCLSPMRQAGITYYDGYDYTAIGRIADEVILMAHDYQWSDGSIKATAPYRLVIEAIEFAIKEIPSHKILLQVSLGPVQWRNGAFSRPAYEDMIAALTGKENDKIIMVTPMNQRFNKNLKVGYAFLRRERYNNGEIEILEDEFYYENALSIEYKRQLVTAYDLKGMSVWRLGMGAEDPLKQFFSHGMPDSQPRVFPNEDDYELLKPVGSSTTTADKEWKITFNQTVDPRTLAQGITVWKNEIGTWSLVSISPVVDPRNDSSVLVKHRDLYSPGEYRLFIDETIMSLHGTGLKKGTVVPFFVIQ